MSKKSIVPVLGEIYKVFYRSPDFVRCPRAYALIVAFSAAHAVSIFRSYFKKAVIISVDYYGQCFLDRKSSYNPSF